MSPRFGLLATWAIVLALIAVSAAAGASPSGLPSTTLAAPLAAPDQSVGLEPFLSGLSSPVFITHAGDGSGRLFVVEQGGLIRLVVNGQVRPTPFLDVSGLLSSGGERGLLGLAFHPQYETNGRFFIFYTAKAPPGTQCLNNPEIPNNECGHNTLAEYHSMEGNPEIANPVPVRTLLSIPDDYSNHNGGMIAFGPDGMLYIGTGDEGGGGDPGENAQDLTSLYGKLLRINIDVGGTPAPPGSGYSIPADNPFVNQNTPVGIRKEIWAYGLRNPWRWSFDRLNGDVYVGDVGQNAWEEIDRIPSGTGGLNFGWDDREGAHCYEPMTGCSTQGRVDPILEYSHASNQAACASITGGFRYRGSASPLLFDHYFYSDACSGRIWRGIPQGGSPPTAWTATEALDTGHSIVSFGEDESGELYVVALGGSIFRLIGLQPATPTPTVPPCPIRPRVVLQSARIGPGTLDVTISTTDSPSIADNQLVSLAFTRIDNALVTTGAHVDRKTPFTVQFANGTHVVRFTVERDTPGLPMHVDMIVVDRCGPWSTFVGAGTAVP